MPSEEHPSKPEQFYVTCGVPETSPSPSHILSFPLLASFLHVWPIWQCYLQEVSHLPLQQDATNLLSHSPLFPWCLQLLCPDNIVSDKNNDVNGNMRRRNQNTHISSLAHKCGEDDPAENKNTIPSILFFFFYSVSYTQTQKVLNPCPTLSL